MIINFSNHPSEHWGIGQKREAEKWGEIIDIPFPEVNPKAGELIIIEMAKKITDQIMEYEPDAVMCQGEFTLCFAVIQRLRERGVKVVAACSGRRIIEETDESGCSEKRVIFEFERFREYV